MFRSLFRLILLLTLGWTAAVSAAVCNAVSSWPDWNGTQQRMISTEGRVIDHSDARLITTSEGQSYAMFFALVNNNRELFRRLVQWTQDNLAKGDLSSNLPSWLWGRKPNGQWGVLDSNSATDSDLWIAYSLLEAGRLWKERGYTTMGNQLLVQIGARAVVDLPGLGAMLLPAPMGFADGDNWRLNPSYLPLQITERLSLEYAHPWQQITKNTVRLLIETSPKGIAPDWISWVGDKQFMATSDSQTIGSYDAIRVYLWVGMLAGDAPHRELLRNHFLSIGALVNSKGQVAEKIVVATAQGSSWGGPGFSAALLPLFKGQSLESVLLSNTRRGIESGMGYYNQMLTLFGLGWLENRYRFEGNGYLVPAWVDCE